MINITRTAWVLSEKDAGNLGTLERRVANSDDEIGDIENAFSTEYSSNMVAPISLSVTIEIFAVALVTSLLAVRGFTFEKKRIGRIKTKMMIANQTAETNRSIISVLFLPDRKRPSLILRTCVRVWCSSGVLANKGYG